MFLFVKLRRLHSEFSAAFWVWFFSFFFFCSDKPSVKWCHGDSSSCSILMWQIKSCRWQVYRQLYLGKCTHGLPTSKYFPLEKNITVIDGWSSVSEITPVAILLVSVTSCFSSELCFPPLPPPTPKKISQRYLLYLWHYSSIWQKRLKLLGRIRNKCTDCASPGVCWITDQMVHHGHSQQQLIPSRHEDMPLTGWRRVQRARLAKTSEEKVQPTFTSRKRLLTAFNSTTITFLPYKSEVRIVLMRIVWPGEIRFASYLEDGPSELSDWICVPRLLKPICLSCCGNAREMRNKALQAIPRLWSQLFDLV